MQIIHTVESISQSTGGVAVMVPSLAAAQARLGLSVSVAYVTGPDDRADRDVLAQCVPNLAAVDFVPVQRDNAVAFLRATSLRRALRRRLAAGDLVHVHGLWRPFCIAAAATARSLALKYVVTPHGMLDPWSLSQSPMRKRVALGLFWTQALNDAHFLHALNQDEADLIDPLGLKCPIHIVPNGIFPEAFEHLSEVSEFRASVAELGQAPYVLFLGRLHAKKGVDQLIQAFVRLCRDHPDLHLVLAGPDEGMRCSLAATVEASSLQSRVHFTGGIYGGLKYAAMRGALTFCLPSRQEGFSMALLEALACGTPVVITRQCHFPEVAAVGAGVEVELSPESICAGIEYFLDPQHRARASESAKALVRQRFSWANIARQMNSNYE